MALISWQEKEKLKEQVELDAQACLFLRTCKGPRYIKSSGKVSIRGRLLRSYTLHLLAKILLEALFIAGQYFLFGFTLDSRYVCQRPPCPHRVDCFLSRPTEKSVIIWFMLVAAAVSLALSLVELFYLCVKATKECMARRQDYTVTPVTPPLPGRKAFRVPDEMIQNGINLELEQHREQKPGARRLPGGAHEVPSIISPENTGKGEVRI